jgi:predicted phosphoribosyltransferase
MDWMRAYDMSRYRDRRHAGRQLAERLRGYRGRPDVLVLALPRGGVPVGFEVARALEAPLDVLIVRKLGLPGQEELAMGAIASGGVRILNPDVVGPLRIPGELIDRVTAREQAELERRERLFRGEHPGIDPAGRTVILVDDGLATGSTMKAAIAALRQRRPAGIVVAVPVAPASTCREMAAIADHAVCVLQPETFGGVGQWYRDFRQTSDEEVRALLAAAREAPAAAGSTGAR